MKKALRYTLKYGTAFVATAIILDSVAKVVMIWGFHVDPTLSPGYTVLRHYLSPNR